MAKHRSHRKPVGKPVSQAKAKEIMHHGEVHGKPLTEKQKGLFGLIAGGGKPTRMKKKKK